jgi:CHAT domain-containing protein
MPLASAYLGLGNYKKSEELLLQNLEINKNIRGEKDPVMIELTCSMALFYITQDEFEKASNLMQKVNEIIIQEFANYSYKTIDLVSRTYAIILTSGGAYKEAIEFYKDNIASLRNNYGEDTLRIASDFEGLGKAFKFNNQNYESIENYKEALKIKEKILGTDHLELSNILANLGEIYAKESKYINSAKNYERSIKILLKILNREVQYVPESKRISFLEKINVRLPREIFVDAFDSDENLKIALLLRLNLQGLIEEIDRKQLKLSNLSIQNKDLYKKIKRINNKLSKLNIDIKERNNLINEKEILEKELFKNIPETKSRIFEIEEVAGSLKENSVLIEYQKYERNKKNYYLAFILKPNSDIEIINLKDAKEIEDKIKIALKSSERLPEFKEQLNEAEDNWKEVGNLIIKPLKEAIGNANTLFISPDSEINRVPFTALGSLKNKKFLSEDFKIRLLTTGRELIKLNNESNSNSYESLVVANPDFDSQLQSQKINNEIYLNNEYQTRSKDSRYKTWPRLPFTTLEGEFIAKKLNAKLLMNEKATVSAVQEVSAPNILHIASHSEYLEDIKIDNTSKNNELNELNNLNQKNLKENSLLRSYVVLAGANYPDFNPNDDGYLTAQEFSKLNFFGTELVVISGCESGQGDIKSGEGIYGLKRAIAISGARSSLLALWKVDDKATYEFMKTYYEQLSFGLGRVEALTETQKIFREKKDDILSSPYVWAAFQLSGDWKPIKFNYN